MKTDGKLAIVETTFPDGTSIFAIEVVTGRKRLTISEQSHPLPNDIRDLTQQLIEKVRNEHGYSS